MVALLAASTGIVGASGDYGFMSLPTMLKRGYSSSQATGMIAATGTLGQIIPPLAQFYSAILSLVPISRRS